MWFFYHLPSFSNIFPLWTERLPEPPWLQAGFPAMFIASLMLPHKYRKAALPLILSYATLIPKYKSGTAMDTYTIAFAASTGIWHWLDIVFGGEPEKRFWWKDNEEALVKEKAANIGNGEQLSPTEVEESKRSGVSWFFWKLRWATSLVTANRGSGWNWKVKGVPEGMPNQYSRLRFIGMTLYKIAYTSVIADIAGCYVHIVLPPKLPSDTWKLVFQLPLWQQVLGSWATTYMVAYLLKLFYNLASVLAVGLYISTPQSWPPLMDSFRQHMYTIRKTWGVAYHQMMRRTTSVPAIWICQKIGLRRGGMASRYVQLYLGFAISAFFHYLGGLNTGIPAVLSLHTTTFILQPIGITIEDAVIALANKLGWKEESAVTRAIGRIWTIGWFSFSLRYYFAGCIAVGIHESPPVYTFLQPTLERIYASWV